MSIQNVGSNVNLLFQSKSLTFTPDQFNKIFQELGFTATQGPANISQNPNALPVKAVFFSKNNLMVFYNPVESLVMFQVINTLNFVEIYEKNIKPILSSLNFVPEIVSMMGLECNTQIISDKSPILSLTSLLKKEFVDGMNTKIGVDNLKAFTIRLIGGEENIESINIAIEPLATAKDKVYHFSMIYRTLDNSKFNQFVNRFGEEMIKEIVKEASRYV
ncbi:MAG: hypothetical protein ACREAK_06295 [Nitrosarchaeum sp.]